MKAWNLKQWDNLKDGSMFILQKIKKSYFIYIFSYENSDLSKFDADFMKT